MNEQSDSWFYCEIFRYSPNVGMEFNSNTYINFCKHFNEVLYYYLRLTEKKISISKKERRIGKSHRKFDSFRVKCMLQICTYKQIKAYFLYEQNARVRCIQPLHPTFLCLFVAIFLLHFNGIMLLLVSF